MNFSSPRRQSNAKFSFFCFKIDRAGTENWDKNLRNCNFCLVLHGLRCAQQFSLPLWWINLTSRLWKLDCMKRRKKKRLEWQDRVNGTCMRWGRRRLNEVEKEIIKHAKLKAICIFFGYNLNKINLLRIYCKKLIRNLFYEIFHDFKLVWKVSHLVIFKVRWKNLLHYFQGFYLAFGHSKN